MRQFKFHPRHIRAIQEGDKRLTMRYGDYDGFRTGHGFKLIDSSNNQIFGEAICLQIYEMDISEIVNTEWEYHRNYGDFAELAIAFSNYYPNRSIEVTDRLTVIEWKDTFRPNPHYDG